MHFRCIICRADVHRLRHIRSNPIMISCKAEAPFAVNFLRYGGIVSMRSQLTSSGLTKSSPSSSHQPFTIDDLQRN
ncbi:hypothetical protein KIN20_001125 [Parelaphostrongylus tenuis]|uniref:Uncharacterized protein n=1 Tax=Parelaphostrongylus tenuis TaxID=148309 RepID=A0AAD5QGR0_PARTN|nr:hypothetical protein KIN20_001125 [Parelaphostrongylus tenuis]